MTPSSLTFTYVQGGQAPASQTLTGTWTAAGVAAFGAALPAGVSQPPWLPAGSGGTSSSHGGTLPISVQPTGLAAGTYTLTLLVGIVDVGGNPIAYRQVPVTLVVKSFGVGASAVSAMGVFGSSVAPAARYVSLGGASGTSWKVTADQPWLYAIAYASTLGIAFAPGALAPGTYQGNVTVRGSRDGAEVGADLLPVTLELVAPVLTVTPASVPLAGLAGHDLSPKEVHVQLDTGVNAYPWSATTAADWLEVSQLDPEVSASVARLVLRPSATAAAWPAGTTRHAEVTVRADVKGVVVEKKLDVSYTLDDLKLRVDADGVALTSTPGLSRLSRSVRVTTNRGLPGTWTAASDQGWLDVTPAGEMGGDVVLTADPTGLASDTVHLATVSVTSPDPALGGGSEQIRVGLWVGSATPAAVTTVPTTQDTYALAVDPVRPYVYLADAAGIAVVNLYTGAQVGTVGVPGSWSLAVSGDGARLYAVDSSGKAVVPVDLATFTLGSPWPLPVPSNGGGLKIALARTNGVPTLHSTAGTIHDPDTGARIGAWPTDPFVPSGSGQIAASRDGSRVCLFVSENAPPPSSLHCIPVDVTTWPAAAVVVGEELSGSDGSRGPAIDVALSPDGTRAYFAEEAPLDFLVADLTGPERLPIIASLRRGDGIPTAVDVGVDGRVYRGISGGTWNTVWVTDAAGTQLASYRLGSVWPRLLAASGDGLRFVVRSSFETRIVTGPP